MGNFSLIVLPTLAEDYNDADNADGNAVLHARSSLVNYITVIGASVCAFIVMVTIISTIIYCINVAKTVKRRKTRRVLPTRQYVQACNGSLSALPVADVHGAHRSPLQIREHYEPPVNVNGPTDDSMLHARVRGPVQRQVTFAEPDSAADSLPQVGNGTDPNDCPLHNRGSSQLLQLAADESLCNRQQCFSLKAPVMSPTRLLSIQDRFCSETSMDTQKTLAVNGRMATRMFPPTGFRSYEDEGYNTAV